MQIAEKSGISLLESGDAFVRKLEMLREDELHPVVSGNKWRKLKYHLEKAKQQRKKRLISWGGAFSNHLHALAFAGKEMGFETMGMLRGHEVDLDNPTMKDCRDWGMELIPIDRSLYACKHEACVQQDLRVEYPDAYLIPEGGGGYLGVAGCTEILGSNSHDIITLASGTGTTAAGIALRLKEHQELWVFPANGDKEEARGLIRNAIWRQLMNEELSDEIMLKIRLFQDPVLGGFASMRKELVQFMNAFSEQFGIQLDSVYTGRMMFQLAKELTKNPRLDKRILAIHSGGLQGNRGMNKRLRYRKWDEIH
jgi:1-aminocyclopropane-1-carboxylate deaminase